MLETILNNFHLEKILWILQKRIAYIMILGVLGGMAGGAYAYLTNSILYRAEVSFYVYSDPDYVYDSSVNISNSEFTQAKNLVQSYILILKSNTILQKVLEEAGLDYGTEALSGRIGTSVVENTAVFYVYTYDSNPYRAMELANAIGRVAPKEIGRIVKSGDRLCHTAGSTLQFHQSGQICTGGLCRMLWGILCIVSAGRTDGYHDPQAVRTEAGIPDSGAGRYSADPGAGPEE